MSKTIIAKGVNQLLSFFDDRNLPAIRKTILIYFGIFFVFNWRDVTITLPTNIFSGTDNLPITFAPQSTSIFFLIVFVWLGARLWFIFEGAKLEFKNRYEKEKPHYGKNSTDTKNIISEINDNLKELVKSNPKTIETLVGLADFYKDISKYVEHLDLENKERKSETENALFALKNDISDHKAHFGSIDFLRFSELRGGFEQIETLVDESKIPNMQQFERVARNTKWQMFIMDFGVPFVLVIIGSIYSIINAFGPMIGY